MDKDVQLARSAIASSRKLAHWEDTSKTYMSELKKNTQPSNVPTAANCFIIAVTEVNISNDSILEKMVNGENLRNHSWAIDLTKHDQKKSKAVSIIWILQLSTDCQKDTERSLCLQSIVNLSWRIFRKNTYAVYRKT